MELSRRDLLKAAAAALASSAATASGMAKLAATSRKEWHAEWVEIPHATIERVIGKEALAELCEYGQLLVRYFGRVEMWEATKGCGYEVMYATVKCGSLEAVVLSDAAFAGMHPGGRAEYMLCEIAMHLEAMRQEVQRILGWRKVHA